MESNANQCKQRTKAAITVLRVLPGGLAGIHATFAAVVFAVAIANPQKSGLLPLLVFFADIPASFFLEVLRKLFPVRTLAVDATVYILLGSAWWYVLGMLIRRGVLAFRRRSVATDV
jgi:hypothetical protein